MHSKKDTTVLKEIIYWRILSTATFIEFKVFKNSTTKIIGNTTILTINMLIQEEEDLITITEIFNKKLEICKKDAEN